MYGVFFLPSDQQFHAFVFYLIICYLNMYVLLLLSHGDFDFSELMSYVFSFKIEPN
jgi:hypothetical protein